jgi:hypothetical protein
LIRREARVKLAGLADLRIAKSRVGCSPCLMRDPKKMPASHRHGCEEVAYLRGFLDDNGVTVSEYTIYLASCR